MLLHGEQHIFPRRYRRMHFKDAYFIKSAKGSNIHWKIIFNKDITCGKL